MDRNSLKSCTVRHCRKRRESVGRCPIGGTSRGCSGATKSVPELTLDGHESSLRRPSFGQYVPAMWSSSFPRYIECRYLEKSCAESNGAVRSRRSEEHTSELQSRLHLVCRL